MDETKTLEAAEAAEELIVRAFASAALSLRGDKFKDPNGKDGEYSVFLGKIFRGGLLEIMNGLDTNVMEPDNRLYYIVNLLADARDYPDIYGFSRKRKDKVIEVTIHYKETVARWRITKTPDGDRADCIIRQPSEMIRLTHEIRRRYWEWAESAQQHIEDLVSGLRTEYPPAFGDDEAVMSLSRKIAPELDDDTIKGVLTAVTYDFGARMLKLVDAVIHAKEGGIGVHDCSKCAKVDDCALKELLGNQSEMKN